MRLALSQGVSLASGQTLEFVFKEQPDLLAGLRVVVGECQLDANLGAELQFFSHQANND
jgi:F-type H+-transporting ATPase subunit b